MAKKVQKRYLLPADYMADPSVHVFDGKIHIYPSHDWPPRRTTISAASTT